MWRDLLLLLEELERQKKEQEEEERRKKELSERQQKQEEAERDSFEIRSYMKLCGMRVVYVLSADFAKHSELSLATRTARARYHFDSLHNKVYLYYIAMQLNYCNMSRMHAHTALHVCIECSD